MNNDVWTKKMKKKTAQRAVNLIKEMKSVGRSDENQKLQFQIVACCSDLCERFYCILSDFLVYFLLLLLIQQQVTLLAANKMIK